LNQLKQIEIICQEQTALSKGFDMKDFQFSGLVQMIYQLIFLAGYFKVKPFIQTYGRADISISVERDPTFF